ncbi:MAG TPA: hypothetical protein PKM25_15895 [Candidatus Ozemobacteraceae bacterium]|nr:hypothetical protein [Candidatus Ozemobacteraceae bacterium]
MPEAHHLNDQLRRLAEEMRKTGFSELRFETGATKMRIVMDPLLPDFASSPDKQGAADGISPTNTEKPSPMPVLVKAERVGVFSWGRQRVEAGGAVVKGQTLGLIKGISIQDQVVSPATGTVLSVFVQESEIIDFGRSLFEILPE